MYVLSPTVPGVTTMVPVVGSVPLQAPLPVHDAALLADQVRVALWPATMLVGCTLKVMAGVGGGGAMLLPPDPPHEDSNTAALTRTKRASPETDNPPRMKRIRDLPAIPVGENAAAHCTVRHGYVCSSARAVLRFVVAERRNLHSPCGNARARPQGRTFVGEVDSAALAGQCGERGSRCSPAVHVARIERVLPGAGSPRDNRASSREAHPHKGNVGPAGSGGQLS